MHFIITVIHLLLMLLILLLLVQMSPYTRAIHYVECFNFLLIAVISNELTPRSIKKCSANMTQYELLDADNQRQLKII